MKYVKQLAIILTITFAGELLSRLIPLPIQTNIYGMLILLFALLTNCLRAEQVKETGKFLVDLMPLFFIPAAVGLLDSWQEVADIYIQVAVIMIVPTFIVMIVSGKITQLAMRLGGEK